MRQFRIIGLLTLMSWSLAADGQDCLENLDRAQQSYFDGAFGRVGELIGSCYQELDGNDKSTALRLLINASLLTRQNDQADTYMQELLDHEPLTESRSTDIVEFKELLNSYEIKTKYLSLIHI